LPDAGGVEFIAEDLDGREAEEDRGVRLRRGGV
jgi:hypothetical protein